MGTDPKLIELLENIALLLELSGENPYKAQAYARAARTLMGYEVDVHRAVAEGTIRQLPGIGASLEAAITEYVQTGRISLYERLRQEIPEGLLELTQLSEVGPKRARQLYEQLGIASVEELEEACRQHRIAALKGFGPKREETLLAAIQAWKQSRGRLHLHTALREAQSWRERLLALPGVTQVIPAGVLRRYAETIGELTLVVVSPHPERLLKGLAKEIPELRPVGQWRLVAQGEKRVPVYCEIAPVDHAGWVLFRHTGSEEFVAAVESELRERGFEPTPQFLARRGGDAVPLRTEEELFALLGLPVIPPEIREGARILANVRREGLPPLVSRADFRGMLHVHSTWSDGKASIQQMAVAAKELGYSYIAICDHSPSAYYAGGLSRERLLQQHAEIDRLNSQKLGIRILKGAEVDILPDGSLDYPEDVLWQLDVVVASVHSHFKQSRHEITARILRALEHPAVHILGHATGRLLLSRPPYEVDMEAVLEAAVRWGKVVELNAQPYRLDVSWEVLSRWRERGILIAVNPDAHSPSELEYTEFGIALARKALFPPKQVVNTLTVEEFQSFCQKVRECR